MAAAPGPPLLEAVVGEGDEVHQPVSVEDARGASLPASGAPAADAEATDMPVAGGTVVDGVGVPPLEDSSSDGSASVGNWLFMSDGEVDDGARTTHGSLTGAAAAEVPAALPPAGGLPRHVFLSSTAARIRSYYLRMPETSRSTPVVHSSWARRPSRFTSPAMRGALRFALTAGGCGLTQRDHVAYAQSLCAVEREATEGETAVGPVSAAFPSAHGFLTAVRHEQNRVLATRRWMHVPVKISGRTYNYYYRDVLQAVLDSLASADTVSFGGLHSAAADAAADNPAEWIVPDDHVRRRTLDADLYVDESRAVRRIHGQDACVVGVPLHADEALVSWSGAHYMFPLRMNVVNVLDNGGRWQTVGYLEHISKAVSRTAASKLVVSDMRNDLLQRCLAVSLRAFTRASEDGVTAPVAGLGSVLLVPRVVGLVVDQVEERSVLALMGNRCRFFCSPCMEDKNMSGSLLGVRAVDRDVITTLEAQLAAALVRAEDPRPSRRRLLAQEHSALAFVPALGAVHGLGTGAHNLYRVVTFDLLHVWKLGILRLLAQRLPAVLTGLCGAGGAARRGSVQATLEALNWRGFELGRNCKVTPSAPGYVSVLCYAGEWHIRAAHGGRAVLNWVQRGQLPEGGSTASRPSLACLTVAGAAAPRRVGGGVLGTHVGRAAGDHHSQRVGAVQSTH